MATNVAGRVSDKPRKNGCLVVSLVIGIAYLVYSACYWGGAVTGQGNGVSQAGATIAVALVAPHLACTTVAVVFNALAAFLRKPSFALVAGILYAVAMALFVMYFFFVIVETVLSFVGYAQLKAQTAQA